MTRVIKQGLLLLTVAWSLALIGVVGHAKSIQYQALKYGTNQTSMASGYFVHPASVKVKHGAYVVTMRIKTAKSLSSYPVKVLSVNGGAPQNVRRMKDRKGNSNLYYSFTTTNLKQVINAALAINVPNVYKAHHKISFKFRTTGLPSLKQTATKHTTSAKVVGQTSIKKLTPDAATPKQSKQAKAKTKTGQLSNKKKASPTASSRSSVASQSVPAASSSDSTTTQRQSAEPQQGNRMPVLIAGIVVIVVVVGGGALWLTGRKR
ncbi:NEAT domain-containing protein [uncultured Secundilactobacillus sp.]|uniref:NEAT domain-containing protein n=1 Tax=uncultured Secundilactobacillus sp. TaxID=2813935 RepID=UPI0025827E54|nr:NEAT domain-containing protein [uncultured Secundilactobacillus sp.]